MRRATEDALRFFNTRDPNEIPSKYFDGNYWVGDDISEDGFIYHYVNDWVEENTNFRRLTADEYYNDSHQYMLLDKSIIYKLAFEWPHYFNNCDFEYTSCLFSSKEGHKLYDRFIEHPSLVCVKVSNKPWTDGNEYRIFCMISSKFISVPLRKNNDKIYWQRLYRMSEKEFDQIYIIDKNTYMN